MNEIIIFTVGLVSGVYIGIKYMSLVVKDMIKKDELLVGEK